MSFFASFRLLVWQLIWFQKDRSETLHPDKFNCLRCDRREKNLANGCPKCELTIKIESYREEAIAQILMRVGRFPKGWTFNQLLNLHSQVSSLLAMRKNRISRKWNMRLIGLAKIILDERNQLRAAEMFKPPTETRPKNRFNRFLDG
jgi:hypothetical protein